MRACVCVVELLVSQKKKPLILQSFGTFPVFVKKPQTLLNNARIFYFEERFPNLILSGGDKMGDIFSVFLLECAGTGCRTSKLTNINELLPAAGAAVIQRQLSVS